jgi:oxygen-dependent protoporphyrinogen oxidase
VSRIAIVGAGLAGLLAADEAVQQGLEVALLEKSHLLGGQLRSHHHEGFVVESGLEGFWGLEDWMNERGLEALPTHFASQQLREGRWLAVGQGLPWQLPRGLGRHLGVGGKMRLATERLGSTSTLPDEDLGGFVRRRLGEEIWALLEAPLIHSLEQAPGGLLSTRANLPNWWASEGRGGLGSLAAGPRWNTLAPGMGQLTETLLARIDGKVQFGLSNPVNVVAPSRSFNTWVVVTEQGRVEANAVVLATPLAQTARILRPLHPQATTNLNQIPAVPSASVWLAYPEATLPSLPAAQLFTPGYRFAELSQVHRQYPNRVPPGYALLRARFWGEDARHNEQELGRLARQEVERLTRQPSRPIAVWVSRHGARPQFTMGHSRRVSSLREALAQLPGLYLATPLEGLGLAAQIEASRRAVQQAANHLSLATPALA